MNVEGATRTNYIVSALGLGSAAGEQGLLNQEERDKITDVTVKTVLWDYFFPILMSMAGDSTLQANLDNTYFGEDGASGMVWDTILLTTQTIPAIVEKSEQGAWEAALLEAWDGIAGMGIVKDKWFELVEWGLLRAGANNERVRVAMGAANKFFAATAAIDRALSIADRNLLTAQIGMSNRAEVWQVKAIDPVVTITPGEVTAGIDQIITFRANIGDDTTPAADGSAFQYHWSCGGSIGHLLNPLDDETPGDAFTSSNDTIRYKCGEAAGDDTVTCRVTLKQGQDIQEIGSDEATVTVQGGWLTPSYSVAVTEHVLDNGHHVFVLTRLVTWPMVPGARRYSLWGKEPEDEEWQGPIYPRGGELYRLVYHNGYEHWLDPILPTDDTTCYYGDVGEFESQYGPNDPRDRHGEYELARDAAEQRAALYRSWTYAVRYE